MRRCIYIEGTFFAFAENILVNDRESHFQRGPRVRLGVWNLFLTADASLKRFISALELKVKLTIVAVEYVQKSAIPIVLWNIQLIVYLKKRNELLLNFVSRVT